ncbi:MAG TPA: hypothetical protein VFV08_05855 [Puia sp.]|nr:hypothetical protein [Puia sp.]
MDTDGNLRCNYSTGGTTRLMFGLLLNLIPGAFKAINGITDAIANERIAALEANTAQAKIKAEENIATLQAQRDALVAESNRSKLPIIIQSLIAVGPSLYILKYYAWDKVLGSFVGCTGKVVCPWFVTDGLNTQMTAVLTAVVGFYFITNIFGRR